MKKNRHTLISLAYSLTCTIYSFTTTLIENIFIRKSKPNADFDKYGFFKYVKKELNLDISKMGNVEKTNKYLENISLNKDEIFLLIKEIFTPEFTKYITNKTGFCYSIDFFIYYSRFPIDKKDLHVSTLKQWYSYQWHFDKPNSQNMLKIIFPINVKSEQSALQMISKEHSWKPLNKNNSLINFVGNSNTLWGFYPNVCYHKDGIPEDKIASQIMFQLNPHSKWVINKSIFKSANEKLNKKLKIWTPEPKFPHISYFNDERIPI